jgi:hypothetical protein
MCVQEGCNLAGRECPVGSGCADLSGITGPRYACVVPCAAATQPGDAGFRCRDVAPAGPSAGDYACHPLPPDHWIDAPRTEDGYCWPGNFGMIVDGPSWRVCIADADCASPFGLGMCLALGGTPGFCTAACNRAVGLTGACGAADPGTGIATGVCAAGFCVQACDPTAMPTGCTGAATACYPIGPFWPGEFSFVVEGATVPAGVCWPRCTDDAWCAHVWVIGTCDTVTGVCSLP